MRFIEFITDDLVTMAINMDQVTSVTLTDARPPMPFASIVMDDGSIITRIRIGTFPYDSVNAALNDENARKAIRRFFDKICEATDA